MSAPTAEDQAAQALAGTPTPQLLRAAYALTHRIHDGCPDSVSTHPRGRADYMADLRAQRDLIDAEVLRRTGDR